MISDDEITVVQLCDGGRFHGVLVHGDAVGVTWCRRKFKAGARLSAERRINCRDCDKRRPT